MTNCAFCYRGCFQALLFSLLIRVSEQRHHVVHATLGETVILPCSTNQINSNVYWRYGEKMTVCDIIRGEVDFEEQDPVYKDRVESFPSEFAKGNFSIKLMRVKQDFEGIYTCNFPSKRKPESIKLTIKEHLPRMSPRLQENTATKGQVHMFTLFSAALLGLYYSCDFLPIVTLFLLFR